MITLETDRLILRALSLDDLDALAAFYADPDVMRFWPRPMTRDEAEVSLRRQIERYDEWGFGLWATVRKEDGRFIGRCGLLRQVVSGADEIEVAYLLGRDFWGQGYATEAAVASRDYAFDRLGARRVISLIRPENAASIRVALRLGMRPGPLTEHAGLPHRVYVVERERRVVSSPRRPK